jgi:chromosome segregation ATPase
MSLEKLEQYIKQEQQKLRVINDADSMLAVIKDAKRLELEAKTAQAIAVKDSEKAKAELADALEKVAKAKVEASKLVFDADEKAKTLIVQAQEKADKIVGTANAEKDNIDLKIAQLNDSSKLIEGKLKEKSSELSKIEEKLATVKEQIARLAGA